MAGLMEDRGRMRTFDYDLTRILLDHIEVTADGKLSVIMFFGTRLMARRYNCIDICNWKDLYSSIRPHSSLGGRHPTPQSILLTDGKVKNTVRLDVQGW